MWTPPTLPPYRPSPIFPAKNETLCNTVLWYAWISHNSDASEYTYEYHSPLLCNQDHMCKGKTRVCLDRSRVCMDCHCTSPHLQLIWYSINHLDYFLFGYMCIHLKPLSKWITILSWNLDVSVYIIYNLVLTHVKFFL